MHRMEIMQKITCPAKATSTPACEAKEDPRPEAEGDSEVSQAAE